MRPDACSALSNHQFPQSNDGHITLQLTEIYFIHHFIFSFLSWRISPSIPMPDTILLSLFLRQVGASKVHSLDYSNLHIILIFPKVPQRLQNILPGKQWSSKSCEHWLRKPLHEFAGNLMVDLSWRSSQIYRKQLFVNLQQTTTITSGSIWYSEFEI